MELVPVDAEALVVGYLAEVMPGIRVSTRVDRRAGQIAVEQTGGDRSNPATDLPMLAVQCWGATGVEASKLCRTAYARLLGIRDHPRWGHLVREVRTFGGPTRFPDPLTDAERYQVTVQINIRPTETGENDDT